MTSKEEREVMIAALERLTYRAPGDDRMLAALRELNDADKRFEEVQTANFKGAQERITLTRKNRALKHEIRRLHRAREQDFEAGKRWRTEFLAHSERLLTELTSYKARAAEHEAEVASLQESLEHAQWWGHVDPAPLKARIVELETEQGELHRELARLRSQLATAREDASEMEKKAIAEGSEALALRAEVAALKASTTFVHVDESLRMSMEAEVASLKARIADLEADASCAERAIIVARDAVLEFGNRPDHWAGPLLTKQIAAALIERAAFELGAIEASDCHNFKPESDQ